MSHVDRWDKNTATYFLWQRCWIFIWNLSIYKMWCLCRGGGVGWGGWGGRGCTWVHEISDAMSRNWFRYQTMRIIYIAWTPRKDGCVIIVRVITHCITDLYLRVAFNAAVSAECRGAAGNLHQRESIYAWPARRRSADDLNRSDISWEHEKIRNNASHRQARGTSRFCDIFVPHASLSELWNYAAIHFA